MITKVHHRNLFDLQNADDVPDLRSRFNRSALNLGFLGLAERSQPEAPGPRQPTHFPWSNSTEFYGARTPDYIAALEQAFRKTDPLDIARRRRWEKLQSAPFLLSQQPSHFEDNRAWLSQRVEFGEPAYLDALAIPIPAPRGEIRQLYFMSCEPISRERASHGVALGSLYALKIRLFDQARRYPKGPATRAQMVELKPLELEVIRWAVAGKTLEDIAAITDLGYRTVRYHLDQARIRYGYATTQQTIVRAALDYRLDPLGR